MAANKGHVDSSVAERRLRPIYDWLDIGSNKKAIQEADKVLKKQPDFLCAKVLKALGLLRLGKHEECETILESVRAEVPVDESTLQAMTIAYREMHQIYKICQIYDSAVQKEPNNEELLTHLFMAYVRVGDFKKQQITARSLYKIRSKNPYYFWGVMSVVMQTREVPEKVARSVVLPLAEKMVVKMVEMEKVEAEQEVQLYLMILEMQDKIQEALDILDGPLGEKLISHLGLVNNKRAALLARLGRWKDAHLLYKKMLREDQDRWNFYQEYFRSSSKLWSVAESERESEEARTRDKSEKLWHIPDVTPKEVLEFLNMLSEINTTRGQKLYRAPFLAKLELFRLMTEANLQPEELIGGVVELIDSYFVPFGSKPCCFNDLLLYLPLVPEERADELMKKLWLSFDLKEHELPVNLNQMQRHINLTKMSRCLGRHENLSVDKKIALVKDLLRRYDHGATLESNKNTTDFPIHDAYALIACHILHELSITENKDDKLTEAAAILEHAFNLSPSNFHFKLLLLRIYSIAGAGDAAQSIFEVLDVKHMQLDSLGWLHCAHLSSTGLVSLASAHYEVALKFFSANYKDSLDHLTYSYKFGSFLKISEFVEFRDRLHNSHHYTRCSVERMLSELLMPTSHEQAFEAIKQMDIAPADDNIEWDKLRDNRDLDVMMSFEPKAKLLAQETVEATFARETALVRLRKMQLRCLAAAFELLRSPSSEAVNGTSPDLLPKLIDELQGLAMPPTSTPRLELNFPFKSRADLIPGSTNFSAFISALQLVNQLVDLRRDPQSAEKSTLDQMVNLAEQVESTCASAEQLLNNDSSLLTRRLALEVATNALETLSYMALLCGVYKYLAQPPVSTGKKGKKKKETADPVRLKVVEGLGKLAKCFLDSCTKLHDGVGRWEARVALVDEATELMSNWSLDDPENNPNRIQAIDNKERRRDQVVEAVNAKLRHSYMESAKELQNLLSMKCRHLSLYAS